MVITFYNTLTREKEKFIPIEPGKAGLYCCGPTVYNYLHIGNLRTYIFEDLLVRTLVYNDYQVKHVVNITDVGHLFGDEDEGEDKMEAGSEREGKTAWEIAELYTEEFKKDFKRLNIRDPNIWCKATDHIKEQIKLVECLEKKGYTYVISDGVYFDTSKLSDYGKLVNLEASGLKAGARVEVNKEKKKITDFALWKFSPKDKKRQMEWESPWGRGFPGWHIECSAMSMKYLGKHFDIHCGGIDHPPVHHTNEIAQSEACTGEKFVNYWMHGEFLVLADDVKMAKSMENFTRLQTLIDEGYGPLDFRYMCLGTHYRKKLQFSKEILDSARNAFSRLKNRIIEFKTPDSADFTDSMKEYKKRFNEVVNDDLNMPEALAVLWEVVRDEYLGSSEKLELIFDFDRIFGLDLKNVEETTIKVPQEILRLVEERNKAKHEKNYKLADEIRNKIRNKGYELIDTKDGVEVKSF
ncbi:MAG: cysteine--tRNA ligase [Ignavibacteria bacterium]